MCFVKKLEYGHEQMVYPCQNHCYHHSLQYPTNNFPYQFSTLGPTLPLHSPITYSLCYSSLMEQLTTDLHTIMQRVSSNNEAIFSSLNRLTQNQALLNQAEADLEENLNKSGNQSLKGSNRQPHCELNQIPFFSNQSVITKIFGEKPYKYKLVTNQAFPRVIYKQRNLNIGVKLVNPDGQPLCNANLIHLCVAVCNNLAQWIIHDNGDFFLQGKTEVDLIHGEAEFKKISPKDVSRHFNAGVVFIVIYAKKSLLKFTEEENKYQKIIDSDFIEPLLIQDITIKAKKKKHRYR